MNDEIKEIKFIEYNGIEGYIELMKHDVEPLNNPECKRIELYYDGKDIKAVLDYITNLQEEVKEANENAEWWSNRFNALSRDNKNYKSRINKAIEYIKQNSKCGGSFIDDKFVIEYIDEIYNGMELLNILNDGDE